VSLSRDQLSPQGRRAVALLLFALLFGWKRYGDAAQTCLPCNPLDKDSVEDCCDQSCLDDANDLFIGCVCQAIPRFDACTGGCQPIAGRCVLTQKCVGACRSKASAFRQSCLKEARRNIRAPEQSDPSGCGADNTKCNIGLRATRRIANACFAEGQKIDRQFCIDAGLLPPVTPSCADTADGAGDQACDDTADPRGCQRACIASALHECYQDCQEACGVDRRAREICQRGCRNSNCGKIKRLCTCHGDEDDNETCSPGEVGSGYTACCLSSKGCRTALGPDVQCIPTTTQTTTTTISTTTSTTTATTTTTTVG